MTVRSPGIGMSASLHELATSAWFAWKATHTASAEEPRAAAEALYQQGWRDCFAASVELAGLRSVLLRWVELLEEDRD